METVMDIFTALECRKINLCKKLGILDFNETYEKLTSQIESMKKADVWFLLHCAGIPYQDFNIEDYNAAKKIIFKSLWLQNQQKYNVIIAWIREYTGF